MSKMLSDGIENPESLVMVGSFRTCFLPFNTFGWTNYARKQTANRSEPTALVGNTNSPFYTFENSKNRLK
jgi:hypothetical protein